MFSTTRANPFVLSSTNRFRAVTSFLALVMGFALSLTLVSTPASATVSVYFSSSAPTSLQTTLIQDLATQYNGVLTPSQFPPGNYYFTVSGKKPVVIVVPPPPPVTPPVASVDCSSWNFVTGYYFGQQDTRVEDLGLVNGFIVGCSTKTSCQVALSSAAAAIYQEGISTPTYIPTPQ